eukprot:CAMPEP_0171018268 /NCGR_PEP_ID=MMETSP0736-20130129/28159_1 /TAXON_ID=186038 /ORGANISM="Fragilariopsis kerguelensis, Strain L26-C5" /LENGTH=125 /DNA_ID=CAMNT_0011454727 /DNA_START=105 /DNA_END=479 /DNA_ORIENTATION=+
MDIVIREYKHSSNNNNSNIRYQEVQIPGCDLDLQKAPSKEVGVETEEQGRMGPETASPSEQQEAEAEDDDAGSSDVLVVFIGRMWAVFFQLLVGLVVGLPLRVVCCVHNLLSSHSVCLDVVLCEW